MSITIMIQLLPQSPTYKWVGASREMSRCKPWHTATLLTGNLVESTECHWIFFFFLLICTMNYLQTQETGNLHHCTILIFIMLSNKIITWKIYFSSFPFHGALEFFSFFSSLMFAHWFHPSLCCHRFCMTASILIRSPVSFLFKIKTF